MKQIYRSYFCRPRFLECVMAPRDAPWPRGPARRTVAVAAGLAVASCSGEVHCHVHVSWENSMGNIYRNTTFVPSGDVKQFAIENGHLQVVYPCLPTENGDVL